MEFLNHFALFLLQTITLVIAFLIIFAGILAIANKGKKDKDKISIKKLNEKYEHLADELKQEILPKVEYKQWAKQLKQKHKAQSKEGKARKRVFVVHFHGDIKASQVTGLRQQITAILTVASAGDEVVISVESGGGVVYGYGLAASQLQRLKQKNIYLTVAIDKVAASGGYLMACVANQIIAAPFAIIGSIGVIAQLPNFNRLLKKNNIEFEQITAGEFKRTLTMFGENTDKARQKMKEDVEDIHLSFKDFVSRNRPQLDIEKVATGEHWLAEKAFDLKLVDSLQTSDDYLLKAFEHADLYEIIYKQKKGLAEKFMSTANIILEKLGFRTENSFEDNLWLK